MATTNPPLAQLALALVVIKLKPAAVSIKDHILALRQHIHCRGHPIGPPNPEQERQLDSITFWRQAYERSEAAQSRLQDRIYELEQCNEALRLAGISTGVAVGGGSGESGGCTKRKTTMMEYGETTGKTTQAKRKRTVKNADEVSKSLLDQPLNQDATTSLMRHLFVLQKLLAKRTDPTKLAVTSTSMCRAAENVINAAFGTVNISTSTKDHIAEVLSSVGGCYPSLLQAIKKITTASDSDPEQERAIGVVIYHTVHLFQVTLECLHSFLFGLAKLASDQSKSKAKIKRRGIIKTATGSGTGLGPASIQQKVNPPDDVDAILRPTYRLLVYMLLTLDPKSTVPNHHESLMQGYLYHLIRRAADMLSLFVFRELETAPLKDTYLPAILPLRMTPVRDHVLETQIGKWESQYLIRALDRAFELCGHAGSDGVVGMDLKALQACREQLQHTLLGTIFGVDGFEQRLKPPRQPDEYDYAKAVLVGETDTPQWFTQELWRLVGWDMLVKMG